jgi:hypothetical protein
MARATVHHTGPSAPEINPTNMAHGTPMQQLPGNGVLYYANSNQVLAMQQGYMQGATMLQGASNLTQTWFSSHSPHSSSSNSKIQYSAQLQQPSLPLNRSNLSPLQGGYDVLNNPVN